MGNGDDGAMGLPECELNGMNQIGWCDPCRVACGANDRRMTLCEKQPEDELAAFQQRGELS